ncbi:MAG: 3-oxoacyl-ACP synthase [bacterium]
MKFDSAQKIPVFVGLAERKRPGGPGSLADSVIPRLEEKLDIRFSRESSRVISKGHTSGFQALKFASEMFRKSDEDICLVCGVDSYLNARALQWLDEHWRLKTEENSDGVIPGEAAAAVLLQKEVKPNGKPKVRIIGLGFGLEEASVLTEEPLLGLGLTEAARAALESAGLEMHEVDFRISDVTGESYGFKELSLVEARLLRERKEDFPLWHCAESIGDTGAAAGICELIYAVHAFLKGYSPGKRAICFTSAVSEDRAVGVIERILN